jgi:hypothetical protein
MRAEETASGQEGAEEAFDVDRTKEKHYTIKCLIRKCAIIDDDVYKGFGQRL